VIRATSHPSRVVESNPDGLAPTAKREGLEPVANQPDSGQEPLWVDRRQNVDFFNIDLFHPLASQCVQGLLGASPFSR